ncbi:MAG: hypothetical protein JSR61_10100 [Proteobacteria bacterium]|nr:hypothetical protein [Pseudomonadota bacterium]
MLADAKRRYETTTESLDSIGLDFEACRTTVRNVAKREGWIRYVPPPRGLPNAARLAAQAEALTALTCPGHVEAGERDGGDGGATRTLDLSSPAGEETMAAPPLRAWNMRERIETLREAVDDEIAAVRALRASLKDVPHSPEIAGRISHTLASLTATLERLHRLEIGAPRPHGADAYDDMPADIDEFRERLARRIRAFVASRRQSDPAAGHPAAGADAP